MKKILCLLTALACVTIHGCSDAEEAETQCSVDCNGLFAGNPDLHCVLWDSSQYIGGTLACSYNVKTKNCEAVTAGCTTETPVDASLVGAREPCNGSTIQCQDPYTCVFVNQGDLALCLEDCAEDQTTCEQDYYCDTRNIIFNSDAVCWGTSGVDGTCLPKASDGGCIGDNVACVPNGIGMSYECKATCDGANVDKEGAAGGCAEGQWCLADKSGYIDGLEFETNADGNRVDCATDATACDASAKYTCRSIRENNQTTEVCGRPAGRCGTKLAAQTNFAEAVLQLGGNQLTADSFCNYLGRSQYCEGFTETPDVTATVDCASLGWGYRLTDDETSQPYTCGSDMDCSVRGAECINWSNGASCGYLASVCVAYCESADGEETYTCPADQVCLPPETRIGFIRELDLNGTVRRCTEGGTCGAGFTCTEFSDGEFCIRHRKVCREVPADPCINVDCGTNGTCAPVDGLATCDCETGYAGLRCDTCDAGYLDNGSGGCIAACNIDCGTHGDCVLEGAVAACTCDANYGGALCDECGTGYTEFPAGSGFCIPDPCESWSCSDHGTCSLQANGATLCTCAAGYTGAHCDACDGGHIASLVDSTNCINDPCAAADACNSRGTCVQGSDDAPECTCVAGWENKDQCACATGQSRVLEGMIDACLEDPCLDVTPCSSHGACTSNVQMTNATLSLAKACSCDTGYLGDVCQFSHVDTCNGHGTVDANGACICNNGWEGDATCSTCTTGFIESKASADTCVQDPCPALNCDVATETCSIDASDNATCVPKT